MINRNLLFALAAAVSLTGCSGKKASGESGKEFEEAVGKAVERQLQEYPQSRVKDLYKSFFQDQFGPGHLVADTAGAGAYLRRELSDCECADSGVAWEPTGWEENFVRVNLSVIKNGSAPYNVFLDAFFRSAQNINAPSLEEWRKEWKEIEAIIRKKAPSLPDYESDLAEIEQNLDQGIYMGHHSRVYEETYSPHYRLIRKDIFEAEIRPLLF
jgi:hypothetical protein